MEPATDLSERSDVRNPQDFRTRTRILEAAGRVFAEKGFSQATSREICELAQANTAAVNYHFGNKEQLYLEVLREADHRLVDRQAIQTILETGTAPEQIMEELFRMLLHSLVGSESQSWTVRLLLREMTAPTQALAEVFQHRIRPNMMACRQVVASIMKLPTDHLAVIRGALSAISQCMFVFQNRHMVELAIPEYELELGAVDQLARHMSVFAIGGFRAIAKEVKRTE
jgi:TetR/AcrR family transcriptional regulator, regulator of cefoperazone and chloramphenicol sensitivity